MKSNHHLKASIIKSAITASICIGSWWQGHYTMTMVFGFLTAAYLTLVCFLLRRS